MRARTGASEGAHRCLMRLYAKSGRGQQALRLYRRLCETLRREADGQADCAASGFAAKYLLSGLTVRNGFIIRNADVYAGDSGCVVRCADHPQPAVRHPIGCQICAVQAPQGAPLLS